MHYYKFNIADWALHTAHLNLYEEAIYFRLINYYYDTEKPIPLDLEKLSRRLRLEYSTGDLDTVINEFFTKTADGYEHKRCEEILKDYRKTIKKNRVNGSKGGRPRLDAALQAVEEKPTGLIVETQIKPTGNPNQEPLTTNHKPLTNNQKDNPLSSVPDNPRNGVPYQKIIDSYHTICTALPKVAVLTAKRKTHIKSRWNEELLGDLDAWDNFFHYVASSPFLCGSNDRGWTADIDFLIKPETAVKCQEGKYNEIQQSYKK